MKDGCRPDTASLERLVGQLIRTAQQSQRKPDASAPVARFGGESADVLLDLEVDGVRCMLLRTAPLAPRDTLVLSPREQEISRMVMKGYPNKTIAKVLDISVWTVGTHLRRIFAKLGVGTRAAMVAELLEAAHDKPAS
jgi:DNA-binding CsgD family transcriptional regulator